jgi:putative Ca2+/H+ antiporter (TMEM165/GDT1 family)
MLGRFVATFLAVFLAELPDKTMVATLVLTTTYRRAFWVWLGAAAAFLVHVTIAVIAGDLLARLPDRPVKLVVAVLFAVGAVVLWRQRGDAADPDQEQEDLHLRAATSPLRIAGIAFTTLLIAEVGDLTQLTIASLAASTGQPVPVFFGGLLALWTVAAIAAASGTAILKRIPVRTVRTGASIVFALLAVVTLTEALA